MTCCVIVISASFLDPVLPKIFFVRCYAPSGLDDMLCHCNVNLLCYGLVALSIDIFAFVLME